MFCALPFRAALRALTSVGLASLVLVVLAATGHASAALRAGTTLESGLSDRGVPSLALEHKTLDTRPAAVMACEQVDEQLDEDVVLGLALHVVFWSGTGQRTVACVAWAETRIGATHVVLRALPARGPPA